MNEVIQTVWKDDIKPIEKACVLNALPFFINAYIVFDAVDAWWQCPVVNATEKETLYE